MRIQHLTNRKTLNAVKSKFVCHLMLAAAVLSLALAQNAATQEIFIQTGFEEFTLGEPPQDWAVRGSEIEVADIAAKTGAKSLTVLGGADGDAVGFPIETENPIISVEFWLYVESGGRSLNVKVASTDDVNENNGGAYINWDSDIVRLYDGGAWQEIGPFETNTWKYVRIVANFEESQFDFSVGNSREDALSAAPKKELAFRNAALGPTAKSVVFHVYSTTVPGHVDDLLIYEGADAIDLDGLTAVDPVGKLATAWGYLKRQ